MRNALVGKTALISITEFCQAIEAVTGRLASIPHGHQLHTTLCPKSLLVVRSWSRMNLHTHTLLEAARWRRQSRQHTPHRNNKPLFEFGANLPHQRLSTVKIFCLISVSPSMREQKQRGRLFLLVKPVISMSFIIYPKQRVGFVLDSASCWKIRIL